MLDETGVEFESRGIAYIKWYAPFDPERYFLRLAAWESDTGWREVCVEIKKDELKKIRDAISKDLGDV